MEVRGTRCVTLKPDIPLVSLVGRWLPAALFLIGSPAGQAQADLRCRETQPYQGPFGGWRGLTRVPRDVSAAESRWLHVLPARWAQLPSSTTHLHAVIVSIVNLPANRRDTMPPGRQQHGKTAARVPSIHRHRGPRR